MPTYQPSLAEATSGNKISDLLMDQDLVFSRHKHKRHQLSTKEERIHSFFLCSPIRNKHKRIEENKVVPSSCANDNFFSKDNIIMSVFVFYTLLLLLVLVQVKTSL